MIAAKIHKPLEYLGLAGTLAGLAMMYLQQGGSLEVLIIGMSPLSVAYFLRAFVPMELQHDDRGGVPLEVIDLLGNTIIPKVSMIGCSVALIGILFEVLHLHGRQMLLIGCSTLAISIAVAILLLLRNQERYRFFIGYLARMVPVLVAGIYLFQKKAG